MAKSARYQELLKIFPLISIQTEQQNEQALAVLIDLQKKSSHSDEELEYLRALAKLIQEFESTAYPLESLSPGEMLEYLTREAGLEFEALVPDPFENLAVVADVLAGRRKISTTEKSILAARFSVSELVFSDVRKDAEVRRSDD